MWPSERERKLMIDPITAVATATAAFNTSKQGFQAGRDIEGMAGDLSRWMGAVSDIKKQVASLSIEIAEKLLKEKLSDDNKQMKIVEDLIKDVKLKWIITELHIDTPKQH